MGRKDSLPEDAPAPRLCAVVKSPNFQGYGFNLHSEKGKEGQFIGKIDPSSPAEACGLFEGDQIIEVNGVNTSNENHKQVVERIKADPAKVGLLVVDPAAAEYYKKRGIVVRGGLANVKHMSATGGQDQETGESETSSQTQLSIEDSLAFAAQVTRDDTPPPVPPKTDLLLEQGPSGTGRSLSPPAPAEEKPSSIASAEEKPSSVASAGEKPSSVASAEEKPSSVASAEEKPSSVASAEEKPSSVASANETVSPSAATPAEAKSDPPPAQGTADSSEVAGVTGAAQTSGRSEAEGGGKPEGSDKTANKETNGNKSGSPRIEASLQVESSSERAQPSPAPSAGSTGTVESAKSAESAPSGGETTDKFGLKLNMTAAEMREYLKTKKRHDPRNDNLSFKRRHEIVSNM